MLDLLANRSKLFPSQRIVTDHPIFRVHCIFTYALLTTFCVMVLLSQFFGYPIKCIVDKVPAAMINTYCWTMATFTMPNVTEIEAHPGVSSDLGTSAAEQRHHTYYQWVVTVLFAQAMLCAVPRLLWEKWENDLMSNIANGLKNGLCSEKDKTEKKSMLIDYLIRRLNQHTWYAYRYWFCEVLCFVNIVFQIFLMDWFFQGDFMSLGWNLFTLDDMPQMDRRDHLITVFPRVTKCTFRQYGPTQQVEIRDAICILPLNILNEKIYIFLWFWFILVATLCGSILVFRFLLIFCRSLRVEMMHARNRMVPRRTVIDVCSKVSIGDWWLLYMLGRNVDHHINREVMMDFSKKCAENINNSK